jgi:hypothetical protein
LHFGDRRVVEDAGRQVELENFHRVLTDISRGVASNDVRAFIVDAFVRGARVNSAEHTEFEGNTAVFTKRRYRDAWNRKIVRRVAASSNHHIKLKARVRARGQRGANWYGESRVKYIRQRCRAMNLWNLQLAGDWHPSFETKDIGPRPHLMRWLVVVAVVVGVAGCGCGGGGLVVEKGA